VDEAEAETLIPKLKEAVESCFDALNEDDMIKLPFSSYAKGAKASLWIKKMIHNKLK
jgi:hypothetical protein